MPVLKYPSRRTKPPTVVRSMRIDPLIWKRAKARAKRERISTNEAVRRALLIWLGP